MPVPDQGSRASSARTPSLRQVQIEQTRATIRSVAMALYETQGFDQTTVDQIARQAGVSQRTVFRYFPSKRSVLTDFEEELDATFRAAMEGRPLPALTLGAVEHALLTWAEVLQAQEAAVMQRVRIIEASGELATYMLESMQAHAEQIRAELEELWPRKAADTERLALTWLINAVLAVAFHQWTNDATKPLTRHTREAIRAIRRAAAE